MALFENKENVVFNETKLIKGENIVKDIVGGKHINQDVIKVYDTNGFEIYSDIINQVVTCTNKHS